MCGDNAERLYVAFSDDGFVCGYCCIQRVLDEVEILRIAVCPDLRRHGIGAELLDFVICDLKGDACTKFFLEVKSDNLPAIGLYESFGFRKIAVRNDYYGKGCHALIYNLQSD